MRIPIRVKFFVVLLAFSLGPILLSRGIMGGAAERLADDLSDKTREELLEIVASEIEHNAISLLTILESRGQTMALGVRMLAQRAEHFLSWEAPETEAKPTYAIDFADPELAPPDAAFVDGYFTKTMNGRKRPIKVSFDHPVFHLPRGVIEKGVDEQIRRLQSLLPTFKEIYGTFKHAPYWLHVGLESGAHMTYPGHGRSPMMYDHRDQDWYKHTQQVTEECAWSMPVVDPTTRQAVATVSYPIRDANGKFIGAASIDVPISAMLDVGDLKSRWSSNIRSFTVSRAPGDTTENDGLLILGQQSYDEGGRRHWMSGIEDEWLVSDDTEKFKILLKAMAKKSSGAISLPYKGEPSVWAYASNDNFTFLLIAPKSAVTRLPDQVGDSLTNLFIEMRDISAIISGLMLIVIGIIAWFGSRKVTKPLLAMAESAKRLANGDFSVRMTSRTGDERDILSDSFNNMVPKLRERMDMRRDLELAKEVQNLLLPRNTPNLSGYDISGGIAYCDQTGGDYYDFIEVQTENGYGLGVVLGDVSGHGVASALVMSTARGQLHSLSQIRLSPKQRINTINKFLSRDLDGTGRFLTMFYLSLKADEPNVRWVRAGHDPAFRYTPETGEFSELRGDGLALGVLEDFEYEDYETTLTSGEVLVIATDGVWEARNRAGEMFGKQRILAIIKENAHTCSEDIRLAIMAAVDVYQGNGQEDDIAVVVIKKV